MSYKLFLDDIREPEDISLYRGFTDDFWDDVEIARSYAEAIKLLRRKGLPDVLMLDYHLGDPEHSGFDVVKYFISMVERNPEDLPKNFKYYIHTDSPKGCEIMEKALEKLLTS